MARGIVMALVGALALLAPAAPAFAEAGGAAGTVATWNGQPMRLGVAPPTASGGDRATGRRAERLSCRRLRAMADQLGETFAGERLRQTVVARRCALENQEARGSTWRWPWGEGGLDGRLPALMRGTYGAWSVHCARVGRYERCALAHEGALTVAGPAADAGDGEGPGSLSEPVRFSSHFVIASIAGHERLLWRVFVADPGGRRPGTAWALSAVTGGQLIREPFDVCGPAGCLMEAEIRSSTSAASALIDGGMLRLEIARAGLPALVGLVPPEGARRGLAALAHRRSREGVMLAAGD
jgi:invasion protein IalB